MESPSHGYSLLEDNDRVLDSHCLPGSGILNWKELARWLPMKIYKDFLTPEVFSKDQKNESLKAFMASVCQSVEWFYTLLQEED